MDGEATGQSQNSDELLTEGCVDEAEAVLEWVRAREEQKLKV